jgi:hypothetical protein
MSSSIKRDAAQKLLNLESQQLIRLYNASEVGFNTGTGKCCGLPNFEHVATEKPQVVPRFAAFAEIWSEDAEFVEPTAEVLCEVLLSKGKVLNIASIAAALENVYAIVTCCQRASQPEYHWDNIGKRWDTLFQELLNT